VTSQPRRNRRVERLDPCRANLVQRPAEPDAVDVPVGRKSRHQHRGIKTAALGIDRLREQERLAFGLRDAAAELPAHQRVHLGVLVDRLVDDHKQPFARKRQHVLVQVGIGARILRRRVAVAREFVGHAVVHLATL
jgi:hypothetical protein